MESEYSKDVARDKQLAKLTTEIDSQLRSLNAHQVETLIFYLKSLHAYYPASENHVAHYDTFSKRLAAICNSPEQLAAQGVAASKLFRAMLTSALAGAVLLAGLGLLLANGVAGAVAIAAAVALFAFAESRFGKPALDAAKDQDRNYFLQCLRASRACNELSWSGLFAFLPGSRPGPQSDQDLESTRREVADLTEQLRNALYNDEYEAYSHRRHQGA